MDFSEILKQESNLNLSDLRDKLQKQLQDLNQTSLELFNNSYDRFYKLSYIISCLAEPIQHLTDPIQGFRDQLGNLCTNHDAYVDEINSKITALEDTSKNKEFSKRLIQFIKRRDRIECQLENIDWSVNLTNDSIKCDNLERINIELYHLFSEVRAIQPTDYELIQIKRVLEASLIERQSQLDQWFESIFINAIEANDKKLIDLVLQTYRQKDATDRLKVVWRNTGFFNNWLSQMASKVDSCLEMQPLSELSQEERNQSQFKLKVSKNIYSLITECWSPELYIDVLELSFSQLACRIINRFADWLAKLRLSDFRIIGPSETENNRQTNFLAKQGAIMRLLIEDCGCLSKLIDEFVLKQTNIDLNMTKIRRELIVDSFKTLDNGLSNVRSLQKLIER